MMDFPEVHSSMLVQTFRIAPYLRAASVLPDRAETGWARTSAENRSTRWRASSFLRATRAAKASLICMVKAPWFRQSFPEPALVEGSTLVRCISWQSRDNSAYHDNIKMGLFSLKTRLESCFPNK